MFRLFVFIHFGYFARLNLNIALKQARLVNFKSQIIIDNQLYISELAIILKENQAINPAKKFQIFVQQASLEMNYLKQLLHELAFNESESSGCEQKSPDESGEFEVIEMDEQMQTVEEKKQNFSKPLSQGEHKSLLPQNGIQIQRHQKEQELQSENNDQKRENNHNKVQYRGQKENEQEESKLQWEKLSNEYRIVQGGGERSTRSQIGMKTKEENQGLVYDREGSASTIQLDEYFMIVSRDELGKKFTTQQEWDQFYSKLKHFEQQQVLSLQLNCSIWTAREGKRPKPSLNLKQLNSLIELDPEQKHIRLEFWNKVAVPAIDIKYKYRELGNKKDPKSLEKYTNKIINCIGRPILEQMRDLKLKPVPNLEQELELWRASIITVLTLYGANDKQIGYSKGLQYIALGLLVAKPHSQSQNNIAETGQTSQSKISKESSKQQKQQNPVGNCSFIDIERHFKYLLFTKQFRNMYFPGTPKLYQEIESLTESMRSEAPWLLAYLELSKVDFIKLFINYYKTFLLFKLTNPQLIRKLMELLVVYGIDLVPIILTRIIARNQHKIRAMFPHEIQLLRYLAQSLLQDYFQHSHSQQLVAKFKHLFILDSLQ